MIKIHYEDAPDTVSIVVIELTFDGITYRMPIETNAPGMPARWFIVDPVSPNAATQVSDVDVHRRLNELAGVVELVDA